MANGVGLDQCTWLGNQSNQGWWKGDPKRSLGICFQMRLDWLVPVDRVIHPDACLPHLYRNVKTFIRTLLNTVQILWLITNAQYRYVLPFIRTMKRFTNYHSPAPNPQEYVGICIWLEKCAPIWKSSRNDDKQPIRFWTMRKCCVGFRTRSWKVTCCCINMYVMFLREKIFHDGAGMEPQFGRNWHWRIDDDAKEMGLDRKYLYIHGYVVGWFRNTVTYSCTRSQYYLLYYVGIPCTSTPVARSVKCEIFLHPTSWWILHSRHSRHTRTNCVLIYM